MSGFGCAERWDEITDTSSTNNDNTPTSQTVEVTDYNLKKVLAFEAGKTSSLNTDNATLDGITLTLDDLDEISVCDEACNMEDNFLICCYNEYMYQYRNNMLKPSGSIIKKNIIKKNIINILPKKFLPSRTAVSVAAFGKKS